MGRDSALFWKLLEPEHPRAEAFSRRLMGNREDGDDLYQDALLVALRRFQTLRADGSFRPWLYQILISTFKNRLRRPWWKRHSSLTDEMAESAAGENPLGVYHARRWLWRAFRALKADERALITLSDLEGWSVSDLAGFYGRPQGTIKARLSRTRAKMRRELIRVQYANGGKSPPVGKVTKASEVDLCIATKIVTE
ncbi:MAG: RNA polymerase sigma factor [Candidatus Zixiibacteriota bacterium]